MQKNSSQNEKNAVLYISKRNRGQLTQLVECLRHMEEVRGSSPLLPTKKDLSAHSDKSFLYQIRLSDLIII